MANAIDSLKSLSAKHRERVEKTKKIAENMQRMHEAAKAVKKA